MTKSNNSDSINKIVLSKKEADRLYDILSDIKTHFKDSLNDGITIEQSSTSGIGPDTKITWNISLDKHETDITDHSVW